MTDTDRSPITVALDTGPLHGHRTGIGHAVAELVGALAEHDDVTVSPYVVSGRAALADGERRLPLPGAAASRLWSRLDVPRADRWLGDVDVVHGTNYVAPPTRHPTVVSVYDCWFLQHPELASPLVRRAGMWLRRRVSEGAWVHCSSAATAKQAGHLLGTDRTRVAHLGPPPMLPDAAGDNSAPIDVLAIGTEERRKGYPDLVRAMGILNQQRGPTGLVIAGATGDDSDALTLAIDSLPADVAARVQRLGPVDQEHKATLLASARVMAYPSLDEGFGFPILEAQRALIPVVARSAGSIPEIAGDGAILVDQGDAPDADTDGAFARRYAAALATALDDDHQRQSVIQAGAVNLHRFSWETCATGLIELYRDAIEFGATS